MNVVRKLATIVPTPIFAAKASISAISASDRRGRFWALSAQNHSATGPRAVACARASTQPRANGRTSAQPKSVQASKAKPAIRPRPVGQNANASATSPRATPTKACTRIARTEAKAQARGRAGASRGMRAICHSAWPPANAVPASVIANPANSQRLSNTSDPATGAPYSPRRVAATSGNRLAAIR